MEPLGKPYPLTVVQGVLVSQLVRADERRLQPKTLGLKPSAGPTP